MTLEAVLLVIAAAALVASLASHREGVLLAAVAAYTALVLWLVFNNLALLLPALGVAIVFGAAVAGRAVRRALRSEVATNCHERHNSSKVVTTNTSMAEPELG